LRERFALAVGGYDVQIKWDRSVLQNHLPSMLLAPVDHHHNLRFPRRQVGGLSESDKIRADLSQRVRVPIDEQKKLDIR
jgi:hypothetical protein